MPASDWRLTAVDSLGGRPPRREWCHYGRAPRPDMRSISAADPLSGELSGVAPETSRHATATPASSPRAGLIRWTAYGSELTLEHQAISPGVSGSRLAMPRRGPASRGLSAANGIMHETEVDPLELILHPVRLRIIHAMGGGRVSTTSDLCRRLTGVSKATVYRQVALLADNGVLDVVDERRFHGAVERRYRLSTSRAVIDPSVSGDMPLDDHRKEFLAAASALISEFHRYLDGDHPNPAADFVGYRQFSLWLSREEVVGLVSMLTPYVRALAGNEPTPERRAFLFSPIFFPLGEEASTASGRRAATRSEPTTAP